MEFCNVPARCVSINAFALSSQPTMPFVGISKTPSPRVVFLYYQSKATFEVRNRSFRRFSQQKVFFLVFFHSTICLFQLVLTATKFSNLLMDKVFEGKTMVMDCVKLMASRFCGGPISKRESLFATVDM